MSFRAVFLAVTIAFALFLAAVLINVPDPNSKPRSLVPSWFVRPENAQSVIVSAWWNAPPAASFCATRGRSCKD
jgi:predicted MFS family arabinose efflux permease